MRRGADYGAGEGVRGMRVVKGRSANGQILKFVKF